MAQDQYSDFDYEDDSSEGSLPKKLRETIDRLKDENRQLKEQNQSYAATERKRVISESLAAKGMNPKIAAFVPSDLDVESVDEWLSEYADVFTGSSQPAEPAPTMVDERAVAASRMAAVEEDSFDPSSVDILAKISEAKSVEDLTALLRQG